MSRVLDRLADAGGFLYLLLASVGYAAFVGPAVPQSLDSPSAVLAQLRNHPPGTTFWIGVGMEAVGLVCLLLFAARLAGRIRLAEPAGWIPGAVLGMVVASIAVKLGSFGLVLAALHTARYDAGTVTALIDVNQMTDTVSNAMDATFILLTGLAGLATRALPRWIGAAGVVAGVAVLAGLAVPGLFDQVQLLMFLWLVATSVWLLVRGSRRPVEAQVPVAAAV